VAAGRATAAANRLNALMPPRSGAGALEARVKRYAVTLGFLTHRSSEALSRQVLCEREALSGCERDRDLADRQVQRGGDRKGQAKHWPDSQGAADDVPAPPGNSLRVIHAGR
jgi:hypothetical protein